MILVIDIGGTNVKYGLVDNGALIRKNVVKTEISSKEDLVTLVKGILKSFEDVRITRLSFSFPGIINDEGVLIRAGALACLDGLNFKEYLEYETGFIVHIENDARCAAIAEVNSGNAVGKKDVVVMTVGTGIGGGVIVDGKVLKGHGFKAGELGMMLLDRDYVTLHQKASTSALIDYYNKGMNTLIDHASIILDTYDTDLKCRKIVDEWLGSLCIAIFNSVSTLNPELVLLGGGISAHPKFINLVKQKMNENPYWIDFSCEIDTCQYYNDAGMMGAYFNAIGGENNVL